MARAGAFGRRHPFRARRPRRAVYPLVGLLLAAGAPSGLLVVRWLAGGTRGPFAPLAELGRDPVGYGYMTLGSALVFGCVGFVLGRRADLLRNLALHDALTGLANRGAFERRLEDEVLRAERYGKPLSLLLLDLDGLKQLNDERGHAAGDAALRRIARTLKATVRRTDLAARVGGDEFAVLAPETPSEEAFELAERVRERIADGKTSEGGNVSVSIGVADFSCIADRTAEGLLEAADDELYTAKSTGRNRTSLRSPPNTEERDESSPAG